MARSLLRRRDCPLVKAKPLAIIRPLRLGPGVCTLARGLVDEMPDTLGAQLPICLDLT